jgi:hypothetical protein
VSRGRVQNERDACYTDTDDLSGEKIRFENVNWIDPAQDRD